MSDILERVAEAIASVESVTLPSKDASDPHGLMLREMYLAQASAAIEAMREPTEAMWGGLARQLVMWCRNTQPSGKSLYFNLRHSGTPIPDWLQEEIPHTTHVPPKGTVAACIWKAMISAALAPEDSE